MYVFLAVLLLFVCYIDVVAMSCGWLEFCEKCEIGVHKESSLSALCAVFRSKYDILFVTWFWIAAQLHRGIYYCASILQYISSCCIGVYRHRMPLNPFILQTAARLIIRFLSALERLIIRFLCIDILIDDWLVPFFM